MAEVKTLIDEETLDNRIQELANEISIDYLGKQPVLVCILKGASYFFTDLTRRINTDSEIDFMRVSSYEGEESTGKVDIKLDLSTDIKDKDVLIIEDIIDTGISLSGLYDHLLEKNPKSLKLCVLLDKPERRVNHDIKPDYTGFVIPNKFVIGYGLDKDEKYRTIPYVSCITTDSDEKMEEDRNNIKKQLVKKKKNILH